MKTSPFLIGVIIIIIVGFVAWWQFGKGTEAPVAITSFEECVAAGNPVMESYPSQCSDGVQTFTENIGNEIEKTDLIRLDSPRPNQSVKSPLTITGEARGYWFFEASFPVVLADWDGRIIAEGIATAEGEWMTENFVPFTATLEYTLDSDTYGNRGTLILQKDNPSGSPENNDALEIPLILATKAAVGAGIPPFKSGVRGAVLLGPVCPVEQYPPDPACADRPFETTVQIFVKGASQPFAVGETNKEGAFMFALPPGAYMLRALGGSPLPICSPADVTVEPNTVDEINLSCDSGIR